MTAIRVRDLAHRAYAGVRREAVLVAILVGSLLARWMLSDRHSYWLDELLSINVYGHWHGSAFEAVSALASNSVHPPLYQLVLYYWVDLFGADERSTRGLSNLYIMLATLFLYLLVRDAFSRRVALATAVAFALMYVPTYYGMETRSYAQTIFLATLSSYALLALMRAGATGGWRPALRSPTAALFLVAGTALLLTHYYNVFFWIAQGILAGLFVLRERAPRRWPAGLGVVAAMYAVQGAAFALIWGRVLFDDFHRRGGAFPAGDGVASPFELLRSVVTPNLDPPRVAAWAGLVIAAAMLARALYPLVGGGGAADRQRAWTVAYLVGWLLLPLVVVVAAFEITGVARYSVRYWLFIVPPLAPLLVLTVEEAMRWVGLALRRLRGIDLPPVWASAATAVAIVALVLPGTASAASEPKDGDWRDMVGQVVHTVRSDPDSSFIIFETAHRRRSMTDFYFDQYNGDIRPYSTLQRSEERRGEYRILTVDEPVIAEHDYLVLLFPHSRTVHFPDALAHLEERYEVRHRQLDEIGNGFIVFDVHPE